MVSRRPVTEEPLWRLLSSQRGLARLLQRCSSVKLSRLPWSSMASSLSSARVLTSLSPSHRSLLRLRSFRSAPKEGRGEPREQLAAGMGSLGLPSQRFNLTSGSLFRYPTRESDCSFTLDAAVSNRSELLGGRSLRVPNVQGSRERGQASLITVLVRVPASGSAAELGGVSRIVSGGGSTLGGLTWPQG